MNRRAFLRLGALGLLGAMAPNRFVIERERDMSLRYEKLLQLIELASQGKSDPALMNEVRMNLRMEDDLLEVLNSWVQPGTWDPHFRDIYMTGKLYAGSATGIGAGALADIGARVHKSTNQNLTIVPGPPFFTTPVTFDTVEYDDANFANLTANNDRLTIPPGGKGRYTVGFYMLSSYAAADYLGIFLSKNATVTIVGHAPQTAVVAGAPFTSYAETDLDLEEGDYLQICPYTQLTTNTLTIYGAAYRPALWAKRIR